MTLSYTYSENPRVFNSIFAIMGYSGTFEIVKPISLNSLKEDELTTFCMQLSEKSLSKVWEEEDDEYWASYLKD
jgi:hypothetical protein